MKTNTCILKVAIINIAIILLTGSAFSDELEFSQASIILEHNAVDHDAEIVAVVKGGDEGLVKLKIFAPDGKSILDVSTEEMIVGLREFSIESAEPDMANVIHSYPEGLYSIQGITVSGKKLRASVKFSHQLPGLPKLQLNKKAGQITWSPVSGATKYMVELEREIEDKDIMKLRIELPPTIRSFSIPKAFLVPGDYQIGILTYGVNGNITVVEEEFSLH
jgi:hypothetical protein